MDRGPVPAHRANPTLPQIARLQGGVFTARQARAEGFPDSTIRARIRSGRWGYVAGRALAEPRPGWTPYQLAKAATLTLPSAVISHRTAASLHGFPGEGSDGQTCDVTLAVHRTGGHAIRSHLLRLQPGEIVCGLDELCLTSPARTALDRMAELSFGPALNLWAWVLTRQILDADGLRAAIDQRYHWYGTAQLRGILELSADGAVSRAEFELHALLKQGGVTGWTANTPVCDREGLIAVVDLLFEKERVVIEVDGFAAHSSRTAFIRDRRRQNRLLAAGYRVLRFTWDDIVRFPNRVIAQIRAAIGRAK